MNGEPSTIRPQDRVVSQSQARAQTHPNMASSSNSAISPARPVHSAHATKPPLPIRPSTSTSSTTSHPQHRTGDIPVSPMGRAGAERSRDRDRTNHPTDAPTRNPIPPPQRSISASYAMTRAPPYQGRSRSKSPAVGDKRMPSSQPADGSPPLKVPRIGTLPEPSTRDPRRIPSGPRALRPDSFASSPDVQAAGRSATPWASTPNDATRVTQPASNPSCNSSPSKSSICATSSVSDQMDVSDNAISGTRAPLNVEVPSAASTCIVLPETTPTEEVHERSSSSMDIDGFALCLDTGEERLRESPVAETAPMNDDDLVSSGFAEGFENTCALWKQHDEVFSKHIAYTKEAHNQCQKLNQYEAEKAFFKDKVQEEEAGATPGQSPDPASALGQAKAALQAVRSKIDKLSAEHNALRDKRTRVQAEMEDARRKVVEGFCGILRSRVAAAITSIEAAPNRAPASDVMQNLSECIEELKRQITQHEAKVKGDCKDAWDIWEDDRNKFAGQFDAHWDKHLEVFATKAALEMLENQLGTISAESSTLASKVDAMESSTRQLVDEKAASMEDTLRGEFKALDESLSQLRGDWTAFIGDEDPFKPVPSLGARLMDIQIQIDHKLAETKTALWKELLDAIKKQVAATEPRIAASAAKLVKEDLIKQMTASSEKITKQVVEVDSALGNRMDMVDTSLSVVTARINGVEAGLASIQQEVEVVKSSKELHDQVSRLTQALEEEKAKTVTAESKVVALEKKIGTQRDRITKTDKKHSEDLAALKAEVMQAIGGLKDEIAVLRKENTELKLVAGDAYRYGGEALQTQHAMFQAAGLCRGAIDLPRSYAAPDWLIHPKPETYSPTVVPATVPAETSPAPTPLFPSDRSQ